MLDVRGSDEPQSSLSNKKEHLQTPSPFVARPHATGKEGRFALRGKQNAKTKLEMGIPARPYSALGLLERGPLNVHQPLSMTSGIVAASPDHLSSSGEGGEGGNRDEDNEEVKQTLPKLTDAGGLFKTPLRKS